MAFDWTLLSPTHKPSARNLFYIAKDKVNNNIVLFGGGQNSGVAGSYLQDTWTFDGTDWTQQSPVHVPAKRQFHPLVYDEANGNTIMFGGFSTSFTPIQDTWKWDGSDWTSLSPAHQPSARFATYMAYDKVNGYILLFGGSVAGGGTLSDTWKWDGSDWTQLSPAHNPPKRGAGGGAMCWDPNLGAIILYGGADGATSYKDTWKWDGTDWTNLSAAGTLTQGRFGSITYCLSTNKVIFDGDGRTAPGAWNGSWANLTGTTPTVADTCAMCEGITLGSIIMWMGQGSSTWQQNTYYGYDTSFVPPSTGVPQIYRRR